MSTETTTAPQLLLGVPELDYHSGPELSSTGARTLLRSPAKYRYERTHPVHKDYFDVGTAAHSKVLGVGAGVAVYPADLLSASGSITAKAKEWAEEQRAAGFVPLKEADAKAVDAMAEEVLTHRTARVLFEREGHSEASAYWTDSETGAPLRARFDRLTTLDDGRALCVDLKTTQDASPRGFAKSVASLCTQQDPWYLDALAALGYDDPAFTFVAVEKEPPYLVGVYQLREDDRRMGREKNALARQIWRDCTEADTWPGYAEEIQFLDLPRWFTYQHETDLEIL
jgi:hypothetical protein